MSKLPLISILMPAKNAGKFIETCIESILSQTYPHWELIVVNDTSIDDTVEKIARFSNDSRILLLKNKGKGIIPALRQAFEFSQGDYITRMDADDRMPENKLEELYTLLVRVGKGHVATGRVSYFSEEFELKSGFLDYEKWLNSLCVDNSHWSQIYKECPVASPAWLIHKEDLLDCAAFDEDTYPEDYDLIFRMRNAGVKVVSTPNVVHFWRDHSLRTSRIDDNYRNNFFAELKMRHFLSIDRNQKAPLYLWGAGKKGKKIAQILTRQGVSFSWVTGNFSKLGHNIYGHFLQPIPSAIAHAQVLVAVSSPVDLIEIKSFQTENTEAEFFFLC